MRPIRLAIFTALFFCAAISNAAVTGTITDQTGKPLAGATIRVFAQETRGALLARLAAGTLQREALATATSAENGSFSITVPSRAVAELVATADGHAYVSFDVAATDDTGTLVLAAAKPIAGKVTAAGKPIGAAIAVTADGAFAVRTADDGTWSLPRSATASNIAILHPDFAASVVRDDKSLDVTLERGAEIRGRVIAPNGRADASGATIIAGPWTIARSDANGAFVVAHAPAKWRSIRVASTLGGAIVANANAKSYDVHLRKPGSFSGTVRDSKTSAPVGGVRIRLAPLTDPAIEETVITNAKGEFAFRGMAPGRYDIATSHPLYRLDAENMMENLGIGEDDVTDLTAHPLAIVRGRVIDEERKPLAGVAISRGDSTAPPRISAADGTFMLRVPAAPALRLLASRSGYAVQATQITAVAGESKDVVITMHRGVALTLHVVDADSKPITDASVTFTDPSRMSMRSQTDVPACGGKRCDTNAEGNVDARLLPGTYDIHVSGPAIVPKHLAAIAIDERSAPMTITVTRGLEISGRAVFSDGQPAPGAMIMVRVDGALTFVAAGDDGTFSMHNAPAGPITLHAELPQVRVPGEDKEVTPPATGVELKVRRGGRVAGRVIDAASHEPITDFNIYLLQSGMPSRQAIPFQSDDGSFVIENIAPGTIELQVVSLGHARASAAGIEVEESKTASGVELKMERAALVKGRITTADGQPISGATAYVKESRDSMTMAVDRALSDASGVYEIGSVPPGDRTIVFMKQGFMRQEKSVDAAGGKELRVDVSLERGRAIAGRVINERNEPLGDAELVSENGTNYQRTRSDAEGGFRIEGLGEGTVRIRAGKEGYATGTAEVDTGSTQPLTMTLRRGATISGRVSGLTPEQLPNVRIYAMNEGSSPVISSVSANGAFTLSGIGDGSLNVRAVYGPRSAQKIVDVVNGAAPPLELTFVDGFTVRGVVTVYGRPLPGALIRFDHVGNQGVMLAARTTGDGSYQIAGVAPGDYEVVVSAGNGFELAQETRTISGAEPQNIDVKASGVRGRVVDARTLAPIAEARVAIDVPGDTVTWQHNVAMTDSDGRFAFEYFKPGSYTLTAQHDSYTATRKLFAVGDAPVELDVQLAAGNAITIRVVDAASGRPLAAGFSLMDSAGSVAFSGDARAEDGVGRAWVVPGTYTLRVASSDYALDARSINVPGADIRVALVRAGRIVATSHTPRTMLRLTGGSESQMSFDGRFERLTPGDYVVELLDDAGKSVAKKAVTVRSGETTIVTFD